MSPLENFVVMSGEMTAYKNKKGEWKKKFGFRENWQYLTENDIVVGEKARAIVCGKQSGCSVIDIDDPNTEHNKTLMSLMSDCSMVQKTKHGFHYVFAYDERLRNTQGDKLDIRTDGGCIFTTPSVAKDTDGNIVACYEWIKTGPLSVLPEEVVEFLSTIGGDRYVKGAQKPTEPQPEPVPPEGSPEPSQQDKMLLKVIDALPVRFVDEYADWITMGMSLFNEGYSVEDWDKVSKKSEKYDGSCSTHWQSFKRQTRGVTGATLWNWLKQTNRVEFYSLMEERNDFWNLIALLNHKDGAKYFYNIHPDAYLFNEVLGWYALGSGNIWKQYDKTQPNGLKRHLADTLQELALDTKKAELVKYARESENEKDKKKQEEATKTHAVRIANIHSAYVKLGSSDFCNGVLSFLPSFYTDDKLEEKMDKNGRVFAFTNGLYDLETLVFRPILPNDYISITADYNFKNTGNPDVRKEIETFFFGLFEDKASVEYLVSIFASCLFGGNRWQEFYVLTGSGGNGKSMISLLLKSVFGGYFLSVDSSLLTKPVERKDQPVPALVEARTCRMMLSCEPESTDKLQVGLLKKMSGGDTIEARTLHSKHIVKYSAMFKLWVLANDVPALSKIDAGIQRRMKVLKFPFAFKRQGEITAPHHRLADPDLERKMTSVAWRDEMLLLLMEVYKKIRYLKASPTCPAVEEQSKEYLDENNPLKEWLEEHYDLGGGEGIQPRELKLCYLNDTRTDNIEDKKFKQLLGFNGIFQKKLHGVTKYTGLTRKQEIV